MNDDTPRRPRTVAVIFARGGSKGVPRKNLALLGGRPLVAHSIEVAQACAQIDDVVVSTDDEEIAAVARAAGARVPFMRPAELATDSVAELHAWKHAIETLRSLGERVDTIVSLPPTSPLRTADDVSSALERFHRSGADFLITVHPATAHPWFNLVSLDAHGRPDFSFRRGPRLIRRQDAPAAWQIASVAFIANADTVMTCEDLYETEVIAHEVPTERAVDIDAPMDLAFVRFLYNERNSS